MRDTEKDVSKPRPGLSSSRASVLVVDDQAANLVAMDAVLRDCGFEPVLANSGHEALLRLSEGSFACVLVDVRMPVIDGFETAALIRKRDQWKELPIVFMTSGEPSLVDYTQGYALGAVDFVTRPLAAEILGGKLKAITQLYLERERARRERDEAFRTNRQYLIPAFESLPLAVWSTDENLVLTYCGGALYGQGELPPAESFIGKSLLDLLQASDGIEHPALAAHRKALLGHSVRYEAERGGEAFEGHVRPLKDDAGRIRGVLGAAVDITERRKAQHQLLSERSRLQLIIDAVPSLMAYVDQDGKYVFVNKAYQEWFGRPREYFEGRHPRELLGAEAFALIQPHVEAALSGRQVTFEARIPYKNGPLRYVTVTYVPHLLQDGRVVGFVGWVTDITELRNREEAQAKRYDVLSRISTVGIFQSDSRGDCLDVNQRWTEITGLSVEEARGQGWASALHPEDRERVFREWYEAARVRRDFRSEYRFRRPDGRITWVLGQASELLDPAGQVSGYVGTVTDITDLREAGAKLEEANTDLEAFAYSVSHDLRTPLRGMSVMAGLLIDDYGGRVLDLEGQDVARRIVEQTGRLDQMIRDLLEYARVSRAEARFESVDLVSVLKESLASLTSETGARKARIDYAGLSGRVLGSPVLLQQVFNNLLSNAIKFVEPGVEPRVDLSAMAQGDVVRIQVEDNGIGIPPGSQEKLFRLFERLQARKDYPGTGVGLALVKRAVERMGGRVGMDRGPRGGCRFWFELRRGSP